MANNDELALKARAGFERWWEVHYHNGNPPRFGWEAYREDGGYKIDDDESELDAMWNAWQAAQNSLLAERDADKKRIAELEREKETMTAAALAMRDDMRDARSLLEARTVSVELPKKESEEAIAYGGSGAFRVGRVCGFNQAIDIMSERLTAAGIKLEVGE